jgi:glycogen debranching enzyme
LIEPTTPAARLLAEVQFGREVCGELDAAEAREWLVTNGLGGFASGTIAGTATRRYHGLLIAALQPPVGRTLLVAGIDESVRYLERNFPLATNRWSSGFVSPSGYLQIESFFRNAPQDDSVLRRLNGIEIVSSKKDRLIQSRGGFVKLDQNLVGAGRAH